MPGRRKIFLSPSVAVLAMGCALAAAQDRGTDRAAAPRPQQPARTAQPAQEFPPEAMDELLALWEGQSAKLETLEVDIYRLDRDTSWGDEAHFAGHAAFKTPDLAYVDYRKVKMKEVPDPKVKGKKKVVPIMTKENRYDSIPFQTILCTGKEVWDYRYDMKQVIVWSLDKDARKRALDEGPLPFLFRMRARDAKQRYTMFLRDQNAKNSLVEIRPLLKDDKDVFSTAWVTLDRDFLLPRRIVLISPDRSKQQYFYLSDIRANKPVNERFFVGVKPGEGWKLERNPGAKEAGAPVPKRARRPGDPQSAQRGAADGNAIQR